VSRFWDLLERGCWETAEAEKFPRARVRDPRYRAARSRDQCDHGFSVVQSDCLEITLRTLRMQLLFDMMRDFFLPSFHADYKSIYRISESPIIMFDVLEFYRNQDGLPNKNTVLLKIDHEPIASHLRVTLSSTDCGLFYGAQHLHF
jgi:hypothetical protein